MLPGHTLYGYLPGGASGGILPASLADIPLDFDTLQPLRLLHRLGRGRWCCRDHDTRASTRRAT